MSVTVDESYAWCRRLARRTGRNFYFSFLTLPRDRFRDMCALYAFMRICDDLGDAGDVPLEERRARLAEWRTRLDRALDEDVYDHEVFPALVEMVRRRGVPRGYLHDVISGVESDLETKRFETFDELSRYCYHVAGAVGLCCIHVWGFHDDRAADAAIDCGLAFQLTNILRDLREDSDVGRVYLPREDLERFEYDESELSQGARNERFHALMEFQVERAREYYQRARRLFDYVDPPGRPILAAMLRIYGGLLKEIERCDYDVFSRRVRLSSWRKLLISLDALVRGRWLRRLTS